MTAAADAAPLLETGAAAVLFASTFVFGGRVHPLRPVFRDRRTAISFCGGMAAAYVFVHVMPELHEARRSLVESASMPLRFEGMAIYFLSLVGFLVFYGLDHLRGRLDERVGDPEGGAAFRLHLGSFAAYVGLMAYLLVHSLEGSVAAVALYAVAVAAHFLALDHALREEHGAAYERMGRFLLAAMCLLGWGAGQLVALPGGVLALLVAFVSGSVIMNSLIMELPKDKDGRFPAFFAGGVAYGLLLIPLGGGL